MNINISNPGEVLNTDNLFSTNEEIEKIAMYFHWEYNKGKDKTLDKVWNELEDSEKDSNRYAARHLPIKLRFLGAKITDTATDCQHSIRIQSQKIKRGQSTLWNTEDGWHIENLTDSFMAKSGSKKMENRTRRS